MINDGLQSLDDLILCVGYPGEQHSIKEFVTPNQVMVKETYEAIGADAWQCWNWVCRNIKYPAKRGRMFDYHTLNAFGMRLLKSSGEFFQLPYQSLLVGIGDCADKSAVLASMLRNFMDAGSVYVSMGTFSGDDGDIDHAWVTIMVDGDWYILETTLPTARDWKPVSELPEYTAVLHANDQNIMSKEDLTNLFCGVRVDATKYLGQVWKCWQCQ
jgi:hypothetical protein